MPKKKPPNKHRKLVRETKPLYDGMLAAQNGCCAVCGSTPKTRRLHIDHDHKTMIVRGLLCFRCNSSIKGWMTPSWLRSTADYLERAA